MTVARILFLARYRLPHALLACQFDHNLVGIDRTCVASPVPKETLWPIFERYGIDTTHWDYVHDSAVLSRNPEIEHWVFKDDYRGPWLRQQAIKLAFLDYLNYDVMLMHDPDTFMIKPWQCWSNGQLNMLAIEDTRHSFGYYATLEKALNIQRQTSHCFVTELVPVIKQDVIDLRVYLEQLHHRHWLDAIIDNVPLEPCVPPWNTLSDWIRWFSEYEFLGNWTMTRRSVGITFQRRHEYVGLDQINQFDNNHNALCDAVPNLTKSLQYDWDRNECANFEHYLKLVNQRLNELCSK